MAKVSKTYKLELSDTLDPISVYAHPEADSLINLEQGGEVISISLADLTDLQRALTYVARDMKRGADES